MMLPHTITISKQRANGHHTVTKNSENSEVVFLD